MDSDRYAQDVDNSYTVDLKPSFLRFVYPVQFKAADFKTVRGNIDSAEWESRVWNSCPLSEPDLLPHVVEFWNSESEDCPPTGACWIMDKRAMQADWGLASNCRWSLVEDIDKTIRFNVTEVQIWVFHSGILFLVFEVHPESTASNDWLDFANYFRFAQDAERAKVEIQKKTEKDKFEQFTPHSVSIDSKDPLFVQILRRIMQTAFPPSANQTSNVDAPSPDNGWKEIFTPGRMIPFVSYYLDSENPTKDENAIFLYRARKFFHADQAIYPSDADLLVEQQGILPYVRDQFFTLSLDGAAFVAFNSPKAADFFRNVMPDHLKKIYFFAFLMAWQQRFGLAQLSQRVAGEWPFEVGISSDDAAEHWAKREHKFEDIRARFLAFTARNYFQQIMQSQNHHNYYRAL